MASIKECIKVKQKSKWPLMSDFFKTSTGLLDKNLNLFTATDCQKNGQPHLSRSGTSNLINSLMAVSLMFAVGCTYKSPSTDTPIPSDTGVDKTFFVTTKTDAKTGKQINVPKTFLCGWASEMETGNWAQTVYTNNAIVPEHCNLVFEITEKKLLGKLVNPTFPNDPTRWELAIVIPINAHYYLEAEKDDNGKDK